MTGGGRREGEFAAIRSFASICIEKGDGDVKFSN